MMSPSKNITVLTYAGFWKYGRVKKWKHANGKFSRVITNVQYVCITGVTRQCIVIHACDTRSNIYVSTSQYC